MLIRKSVLMMMMMLVIIIIIIIIIIIKILMKISIKHYHQDHNLHPAIFHLGVRKDLL